MIPSKSILAIAASLALSGFAVAGPKTYQATGPILEVTDTTIVVQKGEEKWEIARDGKTKVTGDLKVGSKVTVTYTMNAISAEVKGGDAPAKDAPKKGDAPKKKTK
jgi:hypothetical protein